MRSKTVPFTDKTNQGWYSFLLWKESQEDGWQRIFV